MPLAPEVTPDPLLDTIGGAVVESRESPTVMRIGVVTQIIEGSQITVKISGSDILVNCSYLFFQYSPLLGDRVIVLKQDSQWFCIGEMSGSIGSNTPLPNSSFESGTIGAMPDDWSITVISSGAGVPSFLVASPSSVNISGAKLADFGVDSVVAGQSIADVYSSIVAATPDSGWTGAYYLTRAFVATSPPLFSDLEMWIQFLDGAGVLISESLINAFSLAADSLAPVYRRLNLTSFPAGYVLAPANTSWARVRFRGIFDLSATTFVSFFIDNVILRQVA
jgi:hypothetical protein